MVSSLANPFVALARLVPTSIAKVRNVLDGRWARQLRVSVPQNVIEKTKFNQLYEFLFRYVDGFSHDNVFRGGTQASRTVFAYSAGGRPRRRQDVHYTVSGQRRIFRRGARPSRNDNDSRRSHARTSAHGHHRLPWSVWTRLARCVALPPLLFCHYLFPENEQDHEELCEQIRHADVICLVFSVVDDASRISIRDKWMPLLRECQPNTDTFHPVILVGNKSDLINSVMMHVRSTQYIVFK